MKLLTLAGDMQPALAQLAPWDFANRVNLGVSEVFYFQLGAHVSSESILMARCNGGELGRIKQGFLECGT